MKNYIWIEGIKNKKSDAGTVWLRDYNSNVIIIPIVNI